MNHQCRTCAIYGTEDEAGCCGRDDATECEHYEPPLTPAQAATLLQAACEWLRDKDLDSLGAEHASNLRAVADWADGMAR